MLPRRLMLMGRVCPINWDADIPADPGEEVPWGEYSQHKCRIDISKTVKNSEFRARTLIHEAMHGGLDVSGVTELLDPKLEEAICTVAEQVVFANLEAFIQVAKHKGKTNG